MRKTGDMEHIPILMVTAEEKMRNVIETMDAGANSDLAQPFKTGYLGKQDNHLPIDDGKRN
jgi:DNA-binding response OmpR family regulator